MKNPAAPSNKSEVRFEDLFISQVVIWKKKEHFVLNIFLNGKILISPRNSNKKFLIRFTELDEIKKYDSCEKDIKLKPKSKILRINKK